MRALLLLSALLLAGCGGGGGGKTPPPGPGVNCCASTALIAGDFDTEEQEALAAYDQQRDSTADSRAAGGTYYSGAHLQDVRDIAIAAAFNWSYYAFQIVDGYAQSMELDGPAISGMVEDYRASIMGYVLADYDAFTNHPNFSSTAVQQTRAEIVNGMNAEFDALQVALQDAGYT